MTDHFSPECYSETRIYSYLKIFIPGIDSTFNYRLTQYATPYLRGSVEITCFSLLPAVTSVLRGSVKMGSQKERLLL